MTPPLRVCQVLPALDGGGVERGTLELARALVAAGISSTVISAGGRLRQQLIDEGSQHIQLPVGRKSLSTLTLVRPLRRLLAEQAFDILHLRSRLPAWISWLAWRRLPREHRPHLLTTVHGLYSVSAYSAIMTRGERVIAVSNTVRGYLLDNYPALDEKKITVIPRGIDEREFPFGFQPDDEWLTTWRQQFPQLRGHPVLLLPGRLTRLKGHQDLIDLMTTFQEQGRDIQAIIVGGTGKRGQYADELRQTIADRGLKNIVFTGARQDMREIYAVSDIVLSLSRRPESFGRTVIEALSTGTPVLGYDHGGVGEVLGQAFPAGLVPLGDLSALQQRVEAMLANPPVVTPPPYRLQTMTDQTIALYQDLCQR